MTASFMGGVLGSTKPRLWTPPLRELTPETSYGFEVAAFARSIDSPLDEWEEWAIIHAGELLPDGRPRFRKVLILVARQNGKTTMAAVLGLYWLVKAKVEMVLGMSTNLAYAKEAWSKAIKFAEAAGFEHDVRLAAGEEALIIPADKTEKKPEGRYRIAASNRKGGRSLTVDRLILDELREHDDWEAHDAAVPTMAARPFAQMFMISNQGGDHSVVLDSYRKDALAFIENSEGDPRLGLFEWSAPDGADPEDIQALAMANPNLGRRLDPESLLADARRAKAAGGDQLAGFRTENMCQRVNQINPAIDPDAWKLCALEGDMSRLRDRVALCLDVSLDGRHATLVAAACEADGVVRVEVVESWDGSAAMALLKRDLPKLLTKVKPAVFGWFPNGPAARLAAEFDTEAKQGRRSAFPPPGIKVEEIRANIPAVCMGLAEMVDGKFIRHSDDQLLNAHVNSAQKLWQGDSWRYARRGAGSIDGAYAVAGAVHLARTLPPPRSPLVVL
jgi:hypothetical protein